MHKCNYLNSSDMLRIAVSTSAKIHWWQHATAGLYALFKIDGVASLTEGIEMKLFYYY